LPFACVFVLKVCFETQKWPFKTLFGPNLKCIMYYINVLLWPDPIYNPGVSCAFHLKACFEPPKMP
jgi:hypothetical protein